MQMRAMPDPDPIFRLQWMELLFFAVALITGAFGGCAGFMHAGRRSPEVAVAFFLGYLVCGAFGAAMTLAGAWVFAPAFVNTLPKLVLVTGIAGFLTSVSLAGANLTMRFILQKLGVELVIDVKRTDRGKNNG